MPPLTFSKIQPSFFEILSTLNKVQYASKIIACHIKDFSSSDKDLINHDSQCAIGEGFINWKTVLGEIKNTSCEIFALEHDDPKDYKEYVSKSLNFLSNLEV